MEVIHRYNGTYPFFQQHQAGLTYLEILKENLTQEEIALEKSKYKMLKEMEEPSLMKLVKIYREQLSLHLLYEYFPLSLERYIQLRSQDTTHNQKHQVRQLCEQFAKTIDSIINNFIHYQIKTDITIHSIAVTSIDEPLFKLFMDPAAEFHTLTHSNQQLQEQSLEEAAEQYKMFLRDYYKAEKKRLIIEFEEWVQKYFGKDCTATEPNHPNFVISGSKLVFLSQANQRHEKEHKNHIISQLSHQKEGRTAIRNSPNKIDKTDDLKREIKEKNMRKIEEIKNVLNRIESKTPNFNHHPEHKLTPHKNYETTHHTEHHAPPHKDHSPQQHYRHPDRIHIPRHQESHHESSRAQHQTPQHTHNPNLNIHNQNVDSVIFKPEEIVIEKTPRLGENEYLESLEHELQNITDSKHLIKQNKPNPNPKAKRVSTIKEEANTLTPTTPTSSRDIDNKPHQTNRQFQVKIVPTTPKKEGEEKKEDQHHKYKMKITTSHQFEIEGTGEPQIKEIEKDIVEGIRSGRINLSEFPDKGNGFKIETTEIHEVTEPIKVDKNSTISQSPLLLKKNSENSSKNKKINDISGSINQRLADSQHHSNSSNSEHKESNGYNTVSRPHLEADHTAQNFSDKIREAKNKAEQVLKQYAKKKQ